MATSDDDDWLVRSMTRARNDVAAWPEWKKQAMRVLPEPEAEARESEPTPPAVDPPNDDG
jgi:hypothetical protein